MKVFSDRHELLYPKRIISPGIHAKDIVGMNFEDVINVFELRIKNFFFKLGDLIFKKINPKIFFRRKDTDYGFLLICISCIILDMLSLYNAKNLKDTNKTRFTSYILDNFHSSEFKKKFSRGFIKYFRFKTKKFETENANQKNYAEVLWECFRNGILHGAIVMPYGSYDLTPNNITQDKYWKNSKIEHACLVINPNHLYSSVKDHFFNYTLKLRNPKNTTLREYFKNRFEKEFGFVI